jgi:hypothetical protein
MQTTAIVAAVLIAVLTVFQVALALGAPAGAAAWGGNNPGVLPTRLRVASGLVGVFFYPVLGILILDVGGVVDTGLADGDWTRLGMWILTGLFALGSLANFASKSKVERLWGPVSLVLAICCAILALGL